LRHLSRAVSDDKDGGTTRIVSVVLDMTERQQAEDARREHESRYRLLFERAGDAIFQVDSTTGRILDTNRAAGEMTGRSIDDLRELTIDKVSPKGAQQRLAMAAEAVEVIDFGEIEYQRADGSTCIALLTTVPSTGSTFYCIARDITARKQAESESQLQRLELAHANRVSTMGLLASSLAHELNQPLGAILRNAEAAELMLQESTLDREELLAILADIRKDDHRAGNVIIRMRDFMRRREAERQSFDLGLLVEESINLLQPDAERRGVRLSLERPTALPIILGDQVQLQQVVINLAINAMDAVEAQARGDRRVAVRVRAFGEVLEVTVCDNGTGILAEQAGRVFEPFYTTKANGLGMGLAIARGIVESHGGQLSMARNPDRGMAFTFALPVCVSHPVQEQARHGT
jgi:PAS domain S-box-containing protein